jgi:hypothetical protein
MKLFLVLILLSLSYISTNNSLGFLSGNPFTLKSIVRQHLGDIDPVDDFENGFIEGLAIFNDIHVPDQCNLDNDPDFDKFGDQLGDLIQIIEDIIIEGRFDHWDQAVAKYKEIKEIVNTLTGPCSSVYKGVTHVIDELYVYFNRDGYYTDLVNHLASPVFIADVF